MNYFEMRSMFTDILNRTDVTTEDADKLINLGVRRIERRLRTMMQKVTVTLAANPDDSFTMPPDLLSVERLEDDCGVIPRVGTVVEWERGYRHTPRGLFLGVPKLTVDLTYYAALDKTVPTSPTEPPTSHSSTIPDVVVYAALVYACDKYEDQRAMRFVDTFERLMAEVQLADDELQMSGHPVMRNPYEGYI